MSVVFAVFDDGMDEEYLDQAQMLQSQISPEPTTLHNKHKHKHKHNDQPISPRTAYGIMDEVDKQLSEYSRATGKSPPFRCSDYEIVGAPRSEHQPSTVQIEEIKEEEQQEDEHQQREKDAEEQQDDDINEFPNESGDDNDRKTPDFPPPVSPSPSPPPRPGCDTPGCRHQTPPQEKSNRNYRCETCNVRVHRDCGTRCGTSQFLRCFRHRVVTNVVDRCCLLYHSFCLLIILLFWSL